MSGEVMQSCMKVRCRIEVLQDAERHSVLRSVQGLFIATTKNKSRSSLFDGGQLQFPSLSTLHLKSDLTKSG